MSGEDHPMHPLVDADGRITETGAAFIQHAGEIMDETVAKSVSGDDHGQADQARPCAWCDNPATGTALHNDQARYPSCGTVGCGERWAASDDVYLCGGKRVSS